MLAQKKYLTYDQDQGKLAINLKKKKKDTSPDKSMGKH